MIFENHQRRPLNLIWIMPAEGSATQANAHAIVYTSRPAIPARDVLFAMRTVIIANGEPPTQRDIARWLRDPSTGSGQAMLICADGGAEAALALGLKPQLVVGDFDSLNVHDLDALLAGGTQLHRYPTHKDETDLELALLLAIQSFTTENTERTEKGKKEEDNSSVSSVFSVPSVVKSFAEIVVLGARGGRIDHELANILLLAMPALKGTRVIMAHGNERMHLIDARDGETTTTIHTQVGDTVSLIPFGGDAIGVRTDGLEYPLRDESLLIGPARGVSNVMLREEATVTLRVGMLLCVVTENV